MTEEEKIKHCKEIFGRKFDKELRTLDARGTQLKDNIFETLHASKSIGSRYDITEFWIEANEIKCGCWKGTLEEFDKRVKSVYENGNKHISQYMDFISECLKLRNA